MMTDTSFNLEVHIFSWRWRICREQIGYITICLIKLVFAKQGEVCGWQTSLALGAVCVQWTINHQRRYLQVSKILVTRHPVTVHCLEKKVSNQPEIMQLININKSLERNRSAAWTIQHNDNSDDEIITDNGNVIVAPFFSFQQASWLKDQKL